MEDILICIEIQDLKSPEIKIMFNFLYFKELAFFNLLVAAPLAYKRDLRKLSKTIPGP